MTPVPTATLYYNDACSKCRATLALLESHGITPSIVEYLTTPPDAAKLHALGLATGTGVRGVLRASEPEAQALLGQDASDETLVAAMVANPRLIERPILVMDGRAVVCRPPERALELIAPQ